MSCPICGIPSREHFCSAHKRAYQNILATHEVWRRALDSSWQEYLERIERNENSGRWVREVCAFLLHNGEIEEGNV